MLAPSAIVHQTLVSDLTRLRAARQKTASTGTCYRLTDTKVLANTFV
jgi:hypothetical protein